MQFQWVDNAPEMVEQSCREPFFEPHFDQRLVEDVARIRCGPDSLEGLNRQPQQQPLGHPSDISERFA